MSRYKKCNKLHLLCLISPQALPEPKALHASLFTPLLLYNTCHGISPGITTSPPTMRLRALGGSSVGPAPTCLHQGSFFRDWIVVGSLVAGKDAVVPAGVEGGDVVEVAFSRLAFSWPSRDLVKAEPDGAMAVLPHGNSAGEVRKEQSHRGIKGHFNDI